MTGVRGGVVYVYDQFEHESQDPQVASSYKPDSVENIREGDADKQVNKQ